MGRPVLRNENGLTLIEVMIAMVIAFIMFLGLAEGTRLAVMYNVRNDLRDAAVSMGEIEANSARSQPFSVIVGWPPSVSYDNTVKVRSRTVTYHVVRTHANIGSNLEQVTFTVTCPGQDNTVRHAFTTIVRQ